ncbi:hypothetical protein N7499_006226 [Penicillium canescens]|uniref:Carbohydrate kinase PfkB domain-containing protein n=1 Tax=Penicillium canescens TaxID=5083 RepID=A0AAD6ID80_PENCN|nr:uncharacterized protein N7446_002005 [Penicillium canescens]KAJ6043808.1 hypothetical protein N7460_005163 [Penicillium canescens]KAJ6055281.1 hypothetical protein N7444_004379 [Penicillium canescens]KAJ6074228.1 hypothetical protein N7446_002005 [Penicillium canescens]KAJ6081352.1 hypothetical protein N7499_006226 [Penicillium canescens]KAJ6176850.1 hypothetical protein N7485_003764 [Penicillium canescens]
MDDDISFASFGLVVLDEIRFPNRKPLTNVLGGSGAYATLGARLFLPSPQSRSIVWPINIGNDFPEPITKLLQSWDTQLVVKQASDQPSTRGLLEYQDTTFGPKKFKYTTPVLTMQEYESTELLSSKVYHYLATPEDMKTRISNILALRTQVGIQDRPLVIWEPAPLACKAETLQTCLEVAALVDVFSPNHIELARLFQDSPISPDKFEIERLALKILDSGVGSEGNGVVVIRAGENGCLVQSRGLARKWIPPFYETKIEEEQASNVVDPTGAGNAFLGAFSVGWIHTGGDVVEAASYGSVAASFALEQVGMPVMSRKYDRELWNGVSVTGRLLDYRARRESEICVV